MKTVNVVLVGLLLLLFSCTLVFAQAVGDYRSNAVAGTWNVASNWQRYNGTTWVTPPAPPTGSEFITIQSTDSMFISAVVSISGTLKNQGKLGGTPSLTIASGGTYEHAEPNGSIPVCTWSTGSTCKVTGYTSGSKPNNSNQDFYNFTWSCPGQTANIDVSMSGNTVRGNITVDTTGTARVYLTSPAAYSAPITINGSVFIMGGQFSTNGSSTADTIVVTTLGNIVVTGGNFSVSRGSAPDVTWNLHGDFTVSNATLQNSGGSTKINKLSFAGTRSHSISLSNVTYGSSGTGPFTIEVQSGSTLNMGSTVLSVSNTGSFLLLAGGTLETGNAGGVAGAVQCTGGSNGGGNSFSTDANYTFNGSAEQITSTLMPATVADLTINNPTRVRLSQFTTINDTLHLRAGVFDVGGVGYTLGPNGRVSNEGGTIVSVESQGQPIPEVFFVDQNYPNPFNPSTTIKYGLPVKASVSVKVFNLLGQEVATLFDGSQDAGVHVLHFPAENMGSGIYFCRIQADNLVDTKRMVLIR
jgi:hypothetical protein